MNRSRHERPRQILLMERDASVRGLMSDFLVEEGYQVLKSECPVKPADVPNLRPDLLILDIPKAPTSPELDFVSHLKSDAYTAHIPILGLCRIYPSDDVSAWTQQKGIAGLLRKPFDLDDFLDAVQSALGTGSHTTTSAQLDSQPNQGQFIPDQQSTQNCQPLSQID